MGYADYFDEEFYVSKTRSKGPGRIERPEAYTAVTNHLVKIFPERGTLLDIGAGVGARAQSKINAGFDAYCLDISVWAKENSVLPPERHFCSDVCEFEHEPFDIVVAERCLAYPPEDRAFPALKQIGKLSKKWIVLNIMCVDHCSPLIAMLARPGRLNVNGKMYWDNHCRSLGWKLDPWRSAEFMHAAYNRLMEGKGQMSDLYCADCWWVYEK